MIGKMTKQSAFPNSAEKHGQNGITSLYSQTRNSVGIYKEWTRTRQDNSKTPENRQNGLGKHRTLGMNQESTRNGGGV